MLLILKGDMELARRIAEDIRQEVNSFAFVAKNQTAAAYLSQHSIFYMPRSKLSIAF